MLINVIYENTLDGIVSAYLIKHYVVEENDVNLIPYQKGNIPEGDRLYVIGSIEYNDIENLLETHNKVILFMDYMTSFNCTILQKETTYAMLIWNYMVGAYINTPCPYGVMILDDFYMDSNENQEVHGLSLYEISAYHKILWAICFNANHIDDVGIIDKDPQHVLIKSDYIIKGITMLLSENAFPAHFFGKKAIVTETPFRERIVFLGVPEEYDFYIAYTRVDKNKYIVKLFSDTQDVGKITKKFGGKNGEFVTRNIERLWG